MRTAAPLLAALGTLALALAPPARGAEAASPATIVLSFRLDPRLSGPTYGGERWVSPAVFTGATAQEAVEVRASAVDARGRPTPAEVEWSASDPGVVALSRPRGEQVRLTARRAGESRVTLRAGAAARTLAVRVAERGAGLLVTIAQDAVPRPAAPAAAEPGGARAPTPRPAAEARRQGEAFLAENARKEGVVSLPSGLQYRVLRAGTGRRPTDADRVVCHYRVALVDGTEIESSYRRGRPAAFPVARALPGWREALKLMPVGSKWRLAVPPGLAHGERGARARRRSPAVGPGATLILETELLAIQPRPGSPGTTTAVAADGAAAGGN